MTLEEKKEIILKNKDPAMAALESVADKIYDLTDELLNAQGNLMTAKIGNYKVEEFAKELRNDSVKYEDIRTKLMNNDMDLSLMEINYIALAFYFCAEHLTGQYKSLQKASEMCRELTNQLMSADNQEKIES